MNEWERKIQEEVAARELERQMDAQTAEEKFTLKMTATYPKEMRALERSKAKEIFEEVLKDVWKYRRAKLSGLILHKKTSSPEHRGSTQYVGSGKTRGDDDPPSSVTHFYDGERSMSGNSIHSTDVFRSLDFERKYHGRTFGIEEVKASLRYRLYSESTQSKIGSTGAIIGDRTYGYTIHQYDFLDIGVLVSTPKPVMFLESTHASWDFDERESVSEPFKFGTRYGAQSPWQGYMCFFSPKNPQIQDLLVLDAVRRIEDARLS